MSKVITFSRVFPGYHPKKGQPTHFVEKFLNLQWPGWRDSTFLRLLLAVNDKKIKEGKLKEQQVIDFYCSLNPSITEVKMHTIRAGYRWKEGDITNAAIWSGRPYHTPQIIFAPDIGLKKVWNIEMDRLSVVIDKYKIWRFGDEKVELYSKLAKNDGLNVNDFCYWFKFPQPFSGQILCWDENIKY